MIRFDDVLNDQRHVIFSQRDQVINSDKIFEYGENFLNELIERMLKNKKISKNYTENDDSIKKYKLLFRKVLENDNFDNFFSKEDEDIKKILNEKFSEKRKNRINHLGEDRAKELEKRIFLQSIDLNWKSHIQYLEQLRQVIGLRSYGQRDPLVEYKKEAFDLFENLLEKLKFDLTSILLNLEIVEQKEEKEKFKTPEISPQYIGKKMKRNEPCFCGSSKKYKHCCGAL